MVRVHHERIVEPYMSKIKAEAETTAQKVASGRRNQKIEELARAVFGTGAVTRLSNYSDKANPEFAQKLLGGFMHVAALNYLRAFLTDYLPTSIRELVDLLLIKGKWTNKETSQQMSEAFHQLLKQAETIALFDADLAEDGETGRRLKTIALRAERDRKALVQLRMTLRQVNDEAHTLIGDSVQHLVGIARVLKIAHDDVVRPNPSLLINWKDLKPSMDRDIRALIAAVYKKSTTSSSSCRCTADSGIFVLEALMFQKLARATIFAASLILLTSRILFSPNSAVLPRAVADGRLSAQDAFVSQQQIRRS